MVTAPALVPQIVLDDALHCTSLHCFIPLANYFIDGVRVVRYFAIVASVEREAEDGVVHQLQEVAATLLSLRVADPAVAGVLNARDLLVRGVD